MASSNEFAAVMHPGKIIAETILNIGMSQKDLAVRTGFSEKHISTVLNGSKDVSVTFAKRVECATGISAEELMKWQIRYDADQFDKAERNNIHQDEHTILKRLHDVADYLRKIGLLQNGTDKIDAILNFRKFLGVSNLCSVPEITYNAAYRAQIKSNSKVDPYVLWAWVRMCEGLTADIDVASKIDIDKLKGKLSAIKAFMFADEKNLQSGLKHLFAECGIAFQIVHHFTGAPVQGFIRETENGRLILCLTIRQKRQDIFWFTLFHEIAHILNGDVNHRFVDFSMANEMETKADTFAGEVLLPTPAYRRFLMERKLDFDSIHHFAETQGVPDHIVIGRLLRDEFLPYSKAIVEKLPYYESVDEAA